jgi:uncharacterized membrane protein
VIARAFPRHVLGAIEAAIGDSERSHDGELRFAVEGGLDLMPLLKGQSARVRACEVFSNLRVWDTRHNSGVLIYVQLVDHRIEIVADRGISALVPQAQWDAICRGMEQAFKQGQYAQGALDAIRETTALLARHFPPHNDNPDELHNRPVVL